MLRKMSVALGASALGLALALLPGGAVRAAASTFTEVIEIDLTGTVVQGCEEPILLDGSLRNTFHITEDGAGGFTIHDVSHPAGLSGTGLISGDRYQAAGATSNGGHLSADFGFGTGKSNSTLIDRTRLVGTGSALTLDIRTTFHFVKMDGVNRMFFERSSITCS